MVLKQPVTRHLFLVDPVVLSLLVALDLLALEPEGDLVLGGLDTVGAVADVATDILSQPSVSAIHVSIVRWHDRLTMA